MITYVEMSQYRLSTLPDMLPAYMDVHWLRECERLFLDQLSNY